MLNNGAYDEIANDLHERGWMNSDEVKDLLDCIKTGIKTEEEHLKQNPFAFDASYFHGKVVAYNTILEYLLRGRENRG